MHDYVDHRGSFFVRETGTDGKTPRLPERGERKLHYTRPVHLERIVVRIRVHLDPPQSNLVQHQNLGLEWSCQELLFLPLERYFFLHSRCEICLHLQSYYLEIRICQCQKLQGLQHVWRKMQYSFYYKMSFEAKTFYLRVWHYAAEYWRFRVDAYDRRGPIG